MDTKLVQRYNSEEQEILAEAFAPEEGAIVQYYGAIGNGKTYNATADAITDACRGISVYVNWHIEWNGRDETQSIKRVLLNILFFNPIFYDFKKENLHYYEFSDEWAQSQGYSTFFDWFASRTDCKIYADEGHLIFDSYLATKLDMQTRAAILHTRHFNRVIAIISQRPTAIHTTARSNVNVFYKCEKIASWPWLVFRKTAFEFVTGETVDETQPGKRQWYFASKEVLQSYDTRYLRRDKPRSQPLYIDVIRMSFTERLAHLWYLLWPFKGREEGASAPTAPLTSEIVTSGRMRSFKDVLAGMDKYEAYRVDKPSIDKSMKF